MEGQLILHDKVQEIFGRGQQQERELRYLKGERRMRVAMDTTDILDRGAVKGTYKLPTDHIARLMRALEALDNVPTRCRS